MSVSCTGVVQGVGQALCAHHFILDSWASPPNEKKIFLSYNFCNKEPLVSFSAWEGVFAVSLILEAKLWTDIGSCPYTTRSWLHTKSYMYNVSKEFRYGYGCLSSLKMSTELLQWTLKTYMYMCQIKSVCNLRPRMNSEQWMNNKQLEVVSIHTITHMWFYFVYYN